MRRKNLLLVLVALFILGNGLSALAPSLNLLIAARFLAGVPHGAYFGAACLVAAAMAGRIHNPTLLMGAFAANVARANGWNDLRPADSPWEVHPKVS